MKEPVEEKQELDELLHFINGTDTRKEEEKVLSAKAAKRARQKQRKVSNFYSLKNARVRFL